MKTFNKQQAVLLFCGSLLFSHFVWAGSCKELAGEMDQMVAAQKNVVDDLVDNHFSFANTLDDISDEMAMSSSKASPKAIKAMKKTAAAYKKRGQDGRAVAVKLNDATEDLMIRIKECLRK